MYLIVVVCYVKNYKMDTTCNCYCYGFEGENVQEFFFRVAALAFEDAILKDLETEISTTQIGDGSILGKRLHSEIIKQLCSLM